MHQRPNGTHITGEKHEGRAGTQGLGMQDRLSACIKRHACQLQIQTFDIGTATQCGQNDVHLFDGVAAAQLD
ncbi:hypothetical protein SDC9_192340 [bioreactor metagenome]|uniref:Uncharacterized protein n=1 Tax=bioreactor metagenome TaxID=1076179 RepID=A0A645I0H6_9ZZZZ